MTTHINPYNEIERLLSLCTVINHGDWGKESHEGKKTHTQETMQLTSLFQNHTIECENGHN